MAIFQHLLIPGFRSAARIKQEPGRRNELHFVRYLECSIHKYMVYGRRKGLIAVPLGLIWWITNHRIELLSHSCCLAFQCGELEGLAVLPVVYHTEGNRLLRLLFLGFFGCFVGEYVVEQVEKRRLYRFRLRLLERPQGRLHLSAHFVGGHGVGEAVHLPEVPGDDPRRLLELVLLGVRPPMIAEMLGKRFEHVDSSDEQIISLIFEAVRRAQRVEGPAHPFLASSGLLGYDAKFTV